MNIFTNTERSREEIKNHNEGDYITMTFKMIASLIVCDKVCV